MITKPGKYVLSEFYERINALNKTRKKYVVLPYGAATSFNQKFREKTG